MIRILVLSLAIAAASAALPVDFYYQALCPDGFNFFQNQLASTYEIYGDQLNITFVPFGRGFQEVDGYFVCPAGPAECFLNKLQSCVLDSLVTQDEKVSYILCAVNFDAEYPGIECVEEAGLSWSAVVEDCVDGDRGFELQLAAYTRTQILAPTFVPAIVFNGVFDQDLQDRSLTDFAGVVAELL